MRTTAFFSTNVPAGGELLNSSGFSFGFDLFGLGSSFGFHFQFLGVSFIMLGSVLGFCIAQCHIGLCVGFGFFGLSFHDGWGSRSGDWGSAM